MTKIQFDLDRSKKECPPDIYYNQLGKDGKKLFPGITFIKRLVLNRDKVRFKISEQIREADSGEERVDTIEGSYANVGYLYTKPPQAIIVDKDDPKMFKGVVGFGRDEAQERLNWETAIYDIVEYTSPLNLEVFKINSNDDDDHTPAYPNTKTTILKSVVNAVHSNIIGDTDDDILEYLKLICRSKPKWHQSIFDTLRKEHISRWTTMRAFSTSRAKKESIRMKLPYEGAKNKNTTSLGYARKFTTLKNFFWDGMTLSVKNGFQKVFLSTWVDEPNPKTLDVKRKNISDEFESMEDMLNEWVSHYIDMPISEVSKKSKGRFPLIFNGFFAQDIEAINTNGGNPKEVDLVGIDGKPWKRLDV